MVWQAPEGMDEYLEPTELCDSDNEEIKKKAGDIIKDAKTPKEAVMKIFLFVRDEIAYGMDIVDARASRTLKKGMGACLQKPTLQIALLRAVGIPARYHRANVRPDWVQGILHPQAYKRIPNPEPYYVWCECYVSGKWVSCEALLDKALYKAAIEKGLIATEQIPTIDWDGENDLVIVKPWVTEDTFPSMDDVFKKVAWMYRPEFIARIGRFFGNRHINRLRKKGKGQGKTAVVY